MSSGPVSFDFTERMIALRAGSVGVFIVDSFRTRDAKQSFVVARKTLEVSFHGARDLLRFFDGEKVPDDLGIVRGLTRKALRGIELLANFHVAHDLDDLGRLGQSWWLAGPNGYGAVDQARLRIEMVVQSGFDGTDLRLCSDGPGAHPGDFPDIDLTIRNDVGAR